jgi:hypothetical protein
MARGRGVGASASRAIVAMAFAVACCCCCCSILAADAAITYYIWGSNDWSFDSPSYAVHTVHTGSRTSA